MDDWADWKHTGLDDRPMTKQEKAEVTILAAECGSTPLRINLGSGQRPFGEGWLNIDCQAKWNPDIVNVPGEPLPLPDETAEIVVLHHVLEHFGLGEADGLIRECHRVLQPGGSLLVFVPHLEALMDTYRLQKIDEYTLLVNLYGAYMGDEADRHKWNYLNLGHLARTFGMKNNWRQTKAFDWRQIPGADIAQDWWILGMEAIK